MKVNFDAKQYIGKREEQQDSLVSTIINPPNSGFQLHVLADGMGGHNAGSTASKTVCQSFATYFEHHGLQSPEKDLQAALMYANDALAQLRKQRPELDGMGTTVIAVIYNERSNQYSYISVGDSPLYVFSNGQLQRINANHAYYEKLLKMVEAGVISRQEADNDPQRHAITSAIMGDKIPEIDIKTLLLREDAVLIMASDGIQTLDDSTHGEIAQIANRYSDNHEILTAELLRAVEQRNYEYQDNTSIIVIKSSVLNDISQQENKILSQETKETSNTIIPNDNLKTSKKKSWVLWIFISFFFLIIMGSLVFFVLKSSYDKELTKNNGSEKNTLYFKYGLHNLFELKENADKKEENGKLDNQSKNISNTPVERGQGETVPAK